MNEEIRRLDPGAEFPIAERCYINELSNSASDPAASIARHACRAAPRRGGIASTARRSDT